MKLKQHYDIVVVGGGILGAFAAYYLSQTSPESPVLVIEKGMIGSGASNYSLGVHFPFGHTQEKQQQTLESINEWKSLIQTIPNFPITYHNCLALIPEYGKREFLSRIMANDWQELDRSEGEAQLKKENISITDDQRVVSNIHAWSCPVGDLAKKMLLEHRYPNVTVCEGIAVTGYKKQNQDILIETSIGKTVHTKQLLLTVGPWFKQLEPFMESNPQLPEQKTKKIVTLSIDIAPPQNASFIYMFENDSFLLPDFKYRRYLFSYTCNEWNCPPESNQLYLTADHLEKGKTALRRFSPYLAENVTGGRVFCDAYFDDFTPRLYTDPNNEEILGIFGASGSGFRLFPALAKAAAQHFTSGVTV